MVCTYCGGLTRVVNSRHQRKSNQVWRRRHCDACQAVFSTEEIVQHEQAWMVRNDAGQFEPFVRDKLLLSIYKSCEHRPHGLEDARALTGTIIAKLPPHLVENSYGTLIDRDIGRLVQVMLNRFDMAASIRYQAWHPYLKRV